MMKFIGKRAMAILLALVMLMSLFPMAYAAEGSDAEWEDDIQGVFVNIPAPSYEMEVGQGLIINDVTVTGEGPLTYEWMSSNNDVVTVSGNGDSATLTAVSAGQATVTLTVNNAADSGSDSVAITVAEKASTPVSAQADGATNVSLTAGTNQAVSVTASGGSGSYTYRWQGSDGIGVDSSVNRASNTVYGLYAGTGQVTVTVEDTNDSSNYAVVTWNVTVSEAAKPLTAKLDKTQLALSAGKSDTLTITASGGSGDAGNYVYYWQSDNPSVASITGSGSIVTVQAGDGLSTGGTADIQATVFDSSTQTTSVVLHCYVTVKSNQASYDASATATVGSDLGVSYIAKSISSEYSSKFGGDLSFSASVRLDTVSGAAGYLTLQDGSPVRANASYTFAGFQDMVFKPTSAGAFSTKYTITDGGNTISGAIRIQVAGGAGITNATLSPSSLRLATYSSQFLTLSVTPSNAAYTVTWSSSDTRIVTVAGSGSVVNVVSQGNTGTANVVATIRDSSGGTLTKSIPVTVYTDDTSRTYDPSLTITIGSDYYGTSISDSIAKQWKKYFSVTLGDSAKVVFNSTGNTRYGVLRLYSGNQIKANTNYTFADLTDMYFEPYAAGTFNIPYTITYRGDEMSGTIQINIRATSLNVTLSPSSATMTTYSTKYLNLSVSPSNAYYKVAWSSSNTSVATVTGNANTATVTAQGKAGTATITATVTDNYNNKVYRSCSVKVTNNTANTSYDPTVYTTLGVNYTGTGTSDAMASQFRNLYNTTLDANKATIRFSATGDNKVGVMHLANGSAIKANTNYTFAQYRGMYLEPLSVGTFRIPYTLTYNNQVLYGTANVVISSGSVNCTLTLPDSMPYVFNKAVNGVTGGALLSNAIRNAVGSSWTYVRFSNTAGTVGTLYENDRSAVLNGNTNVTAAAMNQLYFVPARTGTYSVAFTVYSNNGKLADGTLKVIVPGSADTSFVDVPADAYYADAVTWALQKEVTAGTTKSTFSPNETVTRAQAVTFLWRAMGKPSAGTSSNPFVDVPANEYYTQAVLWAVRQGITAGTSANTFSPNDTLVQDQMLTFLCRTNGGTASGPNWSDQAMSWAQGMGLFDGMPSPVNAKSRCPRSDVVYYLWKDLT